MEQLSIFDLLAESKPLPSNIKLLSLFSGIGAFEKALDNLGIGYELVNYCEIDKYASKSYSAIHGVSEDKNLWDVTKVDEKALPKDIDLITYGFPCQDISLAGKQKGLFNEDGSKTRSGLFFDALRIIEETKPRVAIAENVKNLVGKKFKEQFQIVLASLEAAGYNNYWQVLNAKNYGVPQNRERVFIVSIRKDIDKGYTFPKGFHLEKRLKDVLEDTVDEKYYLSGKMDGSSPKHNNPVLVWDGYNQRIRADQSCVGTLTQNRGADLKRNGQGIIESVDKSVKPTLVGGVGEKNFGKQYRQGNRVYDSDAIAMCLGSAPVGNAGGNSYLYQLGNLRIRKLTPKECFRLMGFDDSDFHKAELVNSNTQLYKQAGNSIVVDVLEHILKQIFKAI